MAKAEQVPASGSDAAGEARASETARALAELPPQQLCRLEAIEHLIVSIMISRQIQRSTATLVGDHANELANLMKALSGFRHEMHQAMTRGPLDVDPPAETDDDSALDRAIAEFKAAKGQA